MAFEGSSAKTQADGEKSIFEKSRFIFKFEEITWTEQMVHASMLVPS